MNSMRGQKVEKVGLRELKRRATENAIETAAVRLARELGPDEVTVEQICNEAFVSRSTFFNYFPSRDAAIYGRPVDLEPSDRVDELLAKWQDALPVGLALAVLEWMGAERINSDVARERSELINAHPDIGYRLNWEAQSVRQSLEAVVADWLERNPDRIRLGSAEIDAGIVVHIGTLLGEEIYATWAQGTGDNPFDVETLEAAYRVVIERLSAYIDPAAA